MLIAVLAGFSAASGASELLRGVSHESPWTDPADSSGFIWDFALKMSGMSWNSASNNFNRQLGNDFQVGWHANKKVQVQVDSDSKFFSRAPRPRSDSVTRVSLHRETLHRLPTQAPHFLQAKLVALLYHVCGR